MRKSKLTAIAHSNFLLMHGVVRERQVKWKVVESRGARTGFDENGKPSSGWDEDIPQLKIRWGKLAFRLHGSKVRRLEKTFVVEVHYDEALNRHCRDMTHPLRSSGSMTNFNFSERAMTAAKEFLAEEKMRVVSEELHIPFIRIIAELQA